MRTKLFWVGLVLIMSQYALGQSILTIKASLKIEFPKIPVIQDNGFVTYYTIQTEDYFLNIGAMNFNDDPFKESLQELDPEEFYSGTIKGVIDAADNGKELSRKYINVKDWKGLEVKTSSDKGNKIGLVSTHTLILIDRVSLMISFTKLSDKNVDNVIERLLLSIEKI